MFSRPSLPAAIAVVVAGACAPLQGRTEGPTIPVVVEVQNNLNFPSQVSVYAESRAGIRTRLGDVLPTQTRSFVFKPLSFSEQYRLVATRALNRPIVSQSFTVGSDMTGRIIWMMSPNIVGFEDFDTDSTGTADTTKTPNLRK